MVSQQRVDQVLAIVAEVAAEVGTTSAEICASNRKRHVVVARRVAIRRARGAGLSNSVVGKALGMSAGCVTAALNGKQTLADGRRSPGLADMLMPFRRRDGSFQALVISDYVQQTGVTRRQAAQLLIEFAGLGLARWELVNGKPPFRIYDLTPAGREVLA